VITVGAILQLELPIAVVGARKLVESDEVLLIVSSYGTPSNTAIHKYMNAKKVPQLFVATGATKWNDPQNFPWTIGWSPNYQNEARIYAKYILKEKPNARIAVLYQNDDYGKDYLKGLKDGLGDKVASMIVAEDAYDIAETTIDSHVVKMKSLNADVFVDITTLKFAAQAIRKAAEIGWKPLHFLNNVSTSIGAVIRPAGVEKAQDIISVGARKTHDRIIRVTSTALDSLLDPLIRGHTVRSPSRSNSEATERRREDALSARLKATGRG
jgi:branched-chain amino acid transport system substrate-binding protein